MGASVTPLEERTEIASLARELAGAVWPEVRLRAGCAHLVAAFGVVLARRGVRIVVQGGTASWRRLPEELDDGVVSTHFSYVFEPDSPTGLARFRRGLLPEMHVWAVIPDRREAVDLTLGDLPEQCEIAGRLPWLTPRPPPFGWWLWEEEPPGIYAPSEVACRVAYWAVSRLLDELRDRTRSTARPRAG